MVKAADAIIFSCEGFLDWEDKHEYIQGEVFAIEEARREHVIVCLNIAPVLKQHLKRKSLPGLYCQYEIKG